MGHWHTSYTVRSTPYIHSIRTQGRLRTYPNLLKYVLSVDKDLNTSAYLPAQMLLVNAVKDHHDNRHRHPPKS